MIIITSTNKVGIIFNLMGNILSRIEQIAYNEGITIGALEKKSEQVKAYYPEQ